MVEIRALRADDNRDGFRSGDADLDRFFHKFAGQNQFRLHIGTTYVAVRESEIPWFRHYFCNVNCDRQLAKVCPQAIAQVPVTGVETRALAVAETAQGQGIGKQLLKAVFCIAHEMADRTGCVAVVIDAKPAAVEFYQRYGFEAIEVITGELGDRPALLPMILPLGSIPRT